MEQNIQKQTNNEAHSKVDNASKVGAQGQKVLIKGGKSTNNSNMDLDVQKKSASESSTSKRVVTKRSNKNMNEDILP